VFSNTEEWWLSIPEDIRPRKDQPFYHLFAENDETEYVAYVSEQNLLDDETGEPIRHPQIREFFEGFDSKKSQYRLRGARKH
jgi:heat shock protein HspQ